MYTDAAGREIKVGDVILHISRKGSAIYTDIGVVRKRAANFDSIIWTKLDRWNLKYRSSPVEFCPETALYRLDYCVVLPDKSEASLVEEYHIGKGETNASEGATAEDRKSQPGRSGLEVSGL